MITNIIVCDRIPKLSMLRFSHNISIAFLRLFTGCITYSGSLLKLLYLFCLIVSIYIQDFLEEKGIISEKESENAIFPVKKTGFPGSDILLSGQAECLLSCPAGEGAVCVV